MTRPRPLDVPERVPDSGRRAEVRVIEQLEGAGLTADQWLVAALL